MSIFPSLSRNVFNASIKRQAGFLMIVAKLECASLIDSLTDNST